MNGTLFLINFCSFSFQFLLLLETLKQETLFKNREKGRTFDIRADKSVECEILDADKRVSSFHD